MRLLPAVLAAAVLAGCAAGLRPPDAPAVADAVRPTPPSAASPATEPQGTVRVAQPSPVVRWWQQDPEDLGAGDLASLWSLPLYRVDPLGRPVPGLAEDVRVLGGEPWTVEVDLADGAWTDGRPVRAADVVATAEALSVERPAAWAAWVGATAVDDDTVQLSFDRPFAGWAGLLSGAPGVLPADLLEERGLEAWNDELPVTGGPFRLVQREPGVSMTFEAHPSSALGGPRLGRVEVLVVPGAETALGLLAADEVDVVTGHVLVDPSARIDDIADVELATTYGGTRVELAWPDGGGTVEQRSAIAGRFDPTPFVDGLLREIGRRPGGVVPAHAQVPRPGAGTASGTVSVQLPRTVEGVGLLARRLQADFEGSGVDASLVRLDPPEHLDPPVASAAHLRVVRVPPAPSVAALLADVGLDPTPGVAVDAAGSRPLDPMAWGVAPPDVFDPVVDLLAADPRVLAVAEVAVAHVWRPDAVTGIEPSGWPGLGLWNVDEWSVPEG